MIKFRIALFIVVLLTTNVSAKDTIVLKDKSVYVGEALNVYVDVLCDSNSFVIKFRPEEFVEHFKLISSRDIFAFRRRDVPIYIYDDELNAKEFVKLFYTNERKYKRRQKIGELGYKISEVSKKYSIPSFVAVISGVASGIYLYKGYNSSDKELKADHYIDGGVYGTIAVASFLYTIDVISLGRKERESE